MVSSTDSAKLFTLIDMGKAMRVGAFATSGCSMLEFGGFLKQEDAVAAAKEEIAEWSALCVRTVYILFPAQTQRGLPSSYLLLAVGTVSEFSGTKL